MEISNFNIYILFLKDRLIFLSNCVWSYLYCSSRNLCFTEFFSDSSHHCPLPALSSAEPNTIINLHSEHFCIIVIKCETKKQLLINFELPALAGC